MATNSLLKCIRCAKCINTEQYYPVLEQNVVTISVINEWVSPQIITDADYICHLCWKIALEVVNIKIELTSTDNEETKTGNHLDTISLNLKTETCSSDDEDTENNYVPIPKKIKLESEQDKCNELTETNGINNEEKDLIEDSLGICNEGPENSSLDNETIKLKEEPHSVCDENKKNNSHDNDTTHLNEDLLSTCDKDFGKDCHENETNQQEASFNSTYLEEDHANTYEKAVNDGFATDNITNRTNENYDTLEQACRKGCGLCGCSILRRPSVPISREHPTEVQELSSTYIHNNAIREIAENDRVCRKCWMRGQRYANKLIKSDTTKNITDTGSKSNNSIVEQGQHTSTIQDSYTVGENSNNSLLLVNQQCSDYESIVDSAASKSNDSNVEQFQKTSTQDSYTAAGFNMAPLQDNLKYSDSDPEWKPPNAARKGDRRIVIGKSTPKPIISKSILNCIKLTDTYKRASKTSLHCLFTNCETKNPLHMINKDLRIKLLINHKYYVPLGSRICSFHLISNNWDVLFDDSSSKSEFTADHIEHIYSLLKTNRSLSQLNFDNVLNIDKCLLQYWTGMTKEKFIELINEAPEIQNVHRGLTGLLALLMKQHRGDTYECLARLMKISKKTLVGLVKTVNELLLKRGDIIGAFLPSKSKQITKRKIKALKILYI